MSDGLLVDASEPTPGNWNLGIIRIHMYHGSSRSQAR